MASRKQMESELLSLPASEDSIPSRKFGRWRRETSLAQLEGFSVSLIPYTLLREEPILNLSEFHGCGAFFVVVSHVVDPRAYGIAPHSPGIVRSQQFGRRTHILHSRIEPQVAAIWIKNDGQFTALRTLWVF